MFSSYRCRKLIYQVISEHSHMSRKCTGTESFQNSEDKKFIKMFVRNTSLSCEVNKTQREHVTILKTIVENNIHLTS